MWERFTENSRHVVFFAQEEAVLAHTGTVTAEHLLLALLRDRTAFAARVVEQMVSDLELIRAELRAEPAKPDGLESRHLVLSDGAQRAIKIALEEARRQECRHIGPEHLLFGIVQDATGDSGRVLTAYGIDAERTRAAVAKLRPTQFAASSAEPAPVVRAGAAATSVRPPARFTDRARQILVAAREEARRFHGTSVATEHLLLGLCRFPDCVALRIVESQGITLATLAAEIQRQIIEAGLQPGADATAPPAQRSRLERLGVNLDAIQAGIQRQVAQAKGTPTAELELSLASKTAIDLGCDEADALGHNFVGTEHLLLGLMREETGLAARALLLAGVDVERARTAIVNMQAYARASLLDAPGTPATGAAQKQSGIEASLLPASIAEQHALPGDLGVAQTREGRATVEMARDRPTFKLLMRILNAKDSYGYRELVGSDDAIRRIATGTTLKLLWLPRDTGNMVEDACYVRVLSGEFAGRAGWIALSAFTRTGPDDTDFPPEI